jgi:hypothetical protein
MVVIVLPTASVGNSDQLTAGDYRDLSGESGYRALLGPVLFGDTKES